MSRSLRLALLFTASLAGPAALAQVCTGNITLSSQAAVDTFNCTEVTGDLRISGGDIADLTPLAGLTSVGFLGIEANPVLGSLAGLEDLTFGNLFIYIRDNDALTSLVGLEGLTSIFSLDIENNDALTSLAGLDNVTSIGVSGLRIGDDDALTSLAGLDDIRAVGGRGLFIQGNDALTSLAGLESLAVVNGGGCICGGGFNIEYNNALTSLDALESLASVERFNIQGNTALTSLAGLESLTAVGSLSVGGNAALTSLVGLEGLTSVSLSIFDNPVLTSLVGLEGLTSLEGLEIRSNAALTSLAGLENVTAVGGLGLLNIQGNVALRSLDALESLTSVGGLLVGDNDALTSLAGLEGLTSVGGHDDSFFGLYVYDNDALTSLAGLENVTSSVAGEVVISRNPALASLEGLENIASIGIDLSIDENGTLSECACGLSGLISGDPPDFTGVNGTVIINANAPGGQCSSPQVVLDASELCMPVASEPAPGVPDRFALAQPYPNPFRHTATVGFAVPVASDVRLVVYDVLGREVTVLLDGPVAAAHHEVALDGSGWPSGTYLVRMATGGGFTQTQRATVVR